MDDNEPNSRRTFPSPKRKRKKNARMHSKEKEAVINTYKLVEETWPKDSYPYRCDIAEKTAQIMGISRPSVYRCIKEKKTTGRLKSPPRPPPRITIIDKLDDLVLSAIRRKVHALHLNKELPTLDKVLEAVNSDDELPNFKRTTFCRLLHKLRETQSQGGTNGQSAKAN